LAALWLGTARADLNSDAERLDQLFERSSLRIATPDARMHSFDVWLADNEQRRQLGLMYVRQLDPNAGMLFVYPGPFKIGMWMKDTYISLDMLFVNSKGKVVQIVERTTPESLKTISANTLVLGVIELNAGTVERLKIRPGAQVMHPAFGTQR
jgi:hypothetical protein